MYDTLSQVQWVEVQSFLFDGHPPLITQLLALNTIFLLLTVAVRLRRGQVKRRRNFHIQELLILGNFVMLSEDRFMPFINEHVQPLIYNFTHWVL